MLGILGGMGPLATADFQRKLALATSASRDQEHVPIVVWGDPRTPDRTDAILNSGPSPLPGLIAGAASLVTAGAEAIAIPCNTAHHWADEVERAIAPVPLLHIAEAVAEVATARSVDKLGLLATSGTVLAGVYQKRLAARGIDTMLPSPAAQARIQQAIAAVKGGRVNEGARLLRPEVSALLDQGASAIALACTEIPVALADDPNDAFIDATDALARRAVSWWQARQRVRVMTT